MARKAAAKTLPDLLRPGLDILFVGINPSLLSAAQGHYFARKTNRFWPAFSRSRLSEPARAGLTLDRLEPEHDRALLDFGFGFTDLAKRPSANVMGLERGELDTGVAALAAKLERFAPRIACLHGVTVYRPVAKVLAPGAPEPKMGLQDLTIGATRIFLAPNPSPANAHFTPDDQFRAYEDLAACLERIGPDRQR